MIAGEALDQKERKIAGILMPTAIFPSVASPTAKQPNDLMNFA
jgi:hypothetical protein